MALGSRGARGRCTPWAGSLLLVWAAACGGGGPELGEVEGESEYEAESSGETESGGQCASEAEAEIGDALAHLGRAEYGASGGFIEILDIATSGNLVYACTGTQGLMAWDASDEGAPTLELEKVGGPFANGQFPRCQHIGADFDAERMVITSRSDEVQPTPFFYMFDIADVANPVALRGWSGTQRSIEGVALDLGRSRLFAATHNDGVTVFEDDGTQFNLGGGFNDADSDAWQPLLDGDYLYVAEGRTGLRVYEVSGDTPVLLSTTPLSGSVKDLVKDGDLVYLAASSHLSVVDVSTPDSPEVLSETPTFGTALALALGSAGSVVVAEWDEMRVYDVRDPAAPALTASELVPTSSAFSRVLAVDAVPAPVGEDGRVYAGEWEGLHAYAQSECKLAPDIDITPKNLQFGKVEAGSTKTAVLVVRNTGSLPLDVDEIEVSPADSFTTQARELTVPAGGAVAIEVSYTADGTVQVDGEVLLHSNDPDEASRAVDLSGNLTGIDVGDPMPLFDLLDLDGDRWTNTELQGKVTLLAYFATF